jgi:hypothetical protein
MGVRGLELQGVDATDYNTVQRIALGIKSVYIDVVVAHVATVLINVQHPLHGDVKPVAVSRERRRAWGRCFR